MRLPEKFELLGQTINITHSNKDMKDCWGKSLFYENEIRLHPELKNRDLYGQVYCHELAHFLFYVLAEDELCFNEELVDRVGHVLWQFFKQLD